MGFEITTDSHDVDLRVIFDQMDKMYVDNKELHAYKGHDEESIKNIYKDILELAYKQNIETLEVPIMHKTGINETHIYPIAFEAIDDFLLENELDIYLNLEKIGIGFYNNSRFIKDSLFTDIQDIVDNSPIFGAPGRRSRHVPDFVKNGVNPARDASELRKDYQRVNPSLADFFYDNDFYLENNLDEMLKESKSISFGERLLQIIDEKGYEKYSTVYKKAIVKRNVFHSIISDEEYIPKKNTVILFALALELDEKEAVDFLSYAGYAFSNSKKDQIILYCIRNHYYNVMRINGFLYDKGYMPLLKLD